MVPALVGHNCSSCVGRGLAKMPGSACMCGHGGAKLKCLLTISACNNFLVLGKTLKGLKRCEPVAMAPSVVRLFAEFVRVGPAHPASMSAESDGLGRPALPIGVLFRT